MTSVEPIAATLLLPPVASSADLTSRSVASASARESPFTSMVTGGLNELNGKLLAGQTALQQLAVGDVQNLHQLMMQLEESRLSFQLVMQVRNRLLEAYQDVMKMQV